MRIAGGYLGGRLFDAPASYKTHPMSQQIRNALFNSLGNVSGLTVLDAYAGSGAVSFEAASRGAHKIYAIERDPKVFKTLKDNRDKLDLEETVEVSRANCSIWVKQQHIEFDLIIADPPYDHISEKQLNTLAKYLKGGGLFVLSHGTEDKLKIKGLKKDSSNRFGNATLSFFKN